MTEDSQTSLVEAGYDAVHAAMPRSPSLLRIWRDHATGIDFPEDFWHFSFITFGELQRIAGAILLAADSSLVDLGCGTGGPGLYLAQRSGARLTGVDLSGVATGLAAERAARLGLAAARFVRGSFSETGLPAGSADAAVSFDALQYAPDKSAAFVEAARVLRPSGRLAFTAFELEPERAGPLAVLGADPVPDYRLPLVAAGFSVAAYEETPGWEERLTAAYSAIVGAKETLTAEMGQAAVIALMSEIPVTLEQRPYRRRVLCLAELSGQVTA